MVRDRFDELQSRARGNFEEVELGPRTPTPDPFGSRVQNVRGILDDLRGDIFDLREKQAAILALAVVNVEHKNELEVYIGRVREKTRQLRPRLEEIENDFTRFRENPHNSQTEIRIRKNQLDLLQKKMKDLMNMFNESQIEYRERVSKRVKRELQLAGENLSDPEVDRMLASQSTQVFYREVSPLSVAGRLALEDASQRHEEILELESSLATLNDMFTDMYTLVHSQGDMVDNIATNVGNAEAHVEQAATNTKQAVEYKKSAMRKKIICIIITIILILILVIIAIVLGVTLSGRNPLPASNPALPVTQPNSTSTS